MDSQVLYPSVASNVVSPSRVSGPFMPADVSITSPPPAAPPAAVSAAEARQRAELEYQAWAKQTLPEGSPGRVLHLGNPAPTANIRAEPVVLDPTSPKVPPAETIFKQAEERLLETERRVRSEQQNLELEKVKRLQDSENEAMEIRNVHLREIEDKETEWTRSRNEQQQAIDAQRAHVEERERRLMQAETDYQSEMMKADDELKRRALTTEEARRRTTQALEAKLRKEIEAELEADITIRVERELTHGITQQVQAELHARFQEMCEAMRDEMDKAREQMHAEIEQSLTPVVEARLLPALRVQAEQDVQRSIIHQLQETSTAAARLRDELQATIQEKDGLREELRVTGVAHDEERALLTKQLQDERDLTKKLSEELVAATTTLERFAEERKLYPLLKEVENMPGPWSHVNQQIDQLRKENSKLQADTQFSAHEIEMLRLQLMQNLGGNAQTPAQVMAPPAPTPAQGNRPQSPRVSPTRRGVAVPLNFNTPPPQQLHQMDSTGTLDPKSAVNAGMRSFSYSPTTDAQHKSIATTASSVNTKPKIPHKNRFRHTPSKDSNTPTFPFRKEDRERIFFAEMEHLKEQTVKDKRARSAQKKITTPAKTPRTNSRRK